MQLSAYASTITIAIPGGISAKIECRGYGFFSSLTYTTTPTTYGGFIYIPSITSIIRLEASNLLLYHSKSTTAVHRCLFAKIRAMLSWCRC